jgi:hypothetical protein
MGCRKSDAIGNALNIGAFSRIELGSTGLMVGFMGLSADPRPSAAHYRRLAAEMMRLADAAAFDSTRINCLKLAADWQALAVDLEAARPETQPGSGEHKA